MYIINSWSANLEKYVLALVPLLRALQCHLPGVNYNNDVQGFISLDNSD